MRRAVIATLALGAIVSAAVVIVDTVTSPKDQPVAVLGDSITAIGQQQLITSAGRRFRLDVRAAFGARVDQQLAAADQAAAADPTQVVINLGTNDVLQGVPAEVSLQALETMASKFPHAKCIHFVLVNPALEQDGRRPRDAALALNAGILQLAERLGRGDVIRWDNLSEAATNSAEPLGLTDDGIHPSPRGQRELADAEVDALLRCGRPWHIW